MSTNRVLVYSYDPDVQAWVNQLTGTTPSLSYLSSLTTFVVQLKAYGIWGQLDRLWIFATEQQQHARVSIVNPTSTQITEIGSVNWVSLSGYTNLQATTFLNTNYTPTTNGVNYTQNSVSMGLYVSGLAGNASTGLNMGSTRSAGTGSLMQISQGNTGVIQLWINCPQTINVPTTATKSNGMFIIERTASNLTTAYSNGVSVASTNTASASGDIPNLPMYVGSFNNAGTGQGGLTTMNYTMAFVGSGSINQLYLYDAFNTFLFSIYPWQSQTLAYLANIQGYPSFWWAVALDTMIATLVASGDFAKLDRFWIFATEQKQHSTISIVNPTSTPLAATNGMIWTATSGYTTPINNTTNYLNTNFNPSTQGVNFSLNTNLAGLYIIVNNSYAFNTIDIGGFDGSNNYYDYGFNWANNSTAIMIGFNNTVGGGTNYYFTTAGSHGQKGLLSAIRTAGGNSSANVNYYVNSTAQANINTSGSMFATGQPNVPLYIGAANQTNTSINQPTSGRTYSMCYMGSSSINITTFYNAFQKFATTIGFNV